MYCIEYNPLLALFSCSNVPDLAIGNHFKLAPVFLQHVSISFYVLPFFLAPQDVPASQHVLFWLKPWNHPFLQGFLVSFIGEWYLETKI